ncbi:helix-turn-helix transcriptional regulator, partial [Pantoea sp. F_16]
MTIQTPEIIGKRIKAARQQKGITIKDLSLLVNLAPSSIQNYESGIRQPSLDTLKVLAKALECSAVWLSTLSDINEGAENYCYSLINPVVPGRPPLEVDSVMFSAKHIEAHGASPALTKLIKVTDDYLFPDIREGDEVLVNTGDKNIS